ncbi:hypothetical protein N7532_001049 [Penicillium argentinense]|uniref:Putative transcription factor kapC n=1 Tax=Penicillium argentinense TaxID=1131581 RepID=A0A9W9G1Q5_9EURO|nr:uncharacterized protein N7532_001049 [Penicillium argentinense]KAJ5110514.1 hypothetical protein N7532_001049 [Penicillium argentinense]
MQSSTDHQVSGEPEDSHENAWDTASLNVFTSLAKYNADYSDKDHEDRMLHDQLLAAQHHMGSRVPAQPNQQQQQLQPNPMQNPVASRDASNIDPAISGGVMMSSPHTPPTAPQQQPSPDEGNAKYHGKRELSTSKRAAQNRAAQASRAFRQRKETYIRKLEDEVKGLEECRNKITNLSNENYQLRDYIITLQSRLMDMSAEVPELPPNIDLHQPRQDFGMASGLPSAGQPGTMVAPAAPQQGNQHSGPTGNSNDDMTSLNRIASAGLGMRNKPDEANPFMANQFANRRGRDDESTTSHDGMNVPKQEGHGLPL